MKITISEGISCLKTLRERHAELVALRNLNANKEIRFYGADAARTKELDPVYDVKKLDALVTKVAHEIRKLDMAIKAANASITLDYEWDDSVLGQVE